jgi:hypothetical protein
MPVWLQIIGAILGALGSILGGANIWVQWREKKERLEMFCVNRELRMFRVHNPTTRPIELRSMVFETWSREKGRWIERFADSKLPTSPFVLQAFMSHNFTLSSSQSLDLAFDKCGRLRVKTGSGAEYKKKIPA